MVGGMVGGMGPPFNWRKYQSARRKALFDLLFTLNLASLLLCW